MLVNYLKIAVRSLLKNPVYTSINVAGLAVGMTCFLLIALYVQDEYEYDAFHENLDRIVRITTHYSDDSGTRSFARSNPAVGPTLLRDFSEIEQTVRLQRFQGPLQHEDRVFNESQLFFAEASIFDVFTFPLERGNPHTALVNPNTAVLSKTAAHRFFGEKDPIGEGNRARCRGSRGPRRAPSWRSVRFRARSSRGCRRSTRSAAPRRGGVASTGAPRARRA